MLYFALRKIKTLDDIEILISFLTACPNPDQILNTKNADGIDSLDIALSHQNEIVTKFLLDHGAKVEEKHMNELVNPNFDKNLFEYFLEEGFKLGSKIPMDLIPCITFV